MRVEIIESSVNGSADIWKCLQSHPDNRDFPYPILFPPEFLTQLSKQSLRYIPQRVVTFCNKTSLENLNWDIRDIWNIRANGGKLQMYWFNRGWRIIFSIVDLKGIWSVKNILEFSLHIPVNLSRCFHYKILQ